jgi:mono/diheme cytochrome c family protein
MVACMAVFGILLGLVIWGGQGNPVDFAAFHRPAGEGQVGARPQPPSEPGLWDRIAYGGREGRGANLDAPAVPGGSYPARPEWYFLFLFQLLKYFPGGSIVGTVLIPNGVGLLLFLLPFLGYGRLRRLGHLVAVLVVVALLCAVATLTCFALADDTQRALPRLLLLELGTYVIPGLGGLFLIYLALLGLMRQGGLRRFVSFTGGLLLLVLLAGACTGIYAALNNEIPAEVQAFLQERRREHTAEEVGHELEALKRGKGFRHQLELAEAEGKRAVVLAAGGIPAEGAAQLLQRDPETQGPRLFRTHCATCHSYRYDPVTRRDFFHPRPEKKGAEDKLPIFKAGDLAGFGTKDWIHRMFKEWDRPQCFGATPFAKGDMARYLRQVWGKKGPEALRKKNPRQFQELDKMFGDVAAWLATHPTGPPKKDSPEAVRNGWETYTNDCRKCHSLGGQGGTDRGSRGPDLTGYGSADWLRMMITDPHDPLRYGRPPGRAWNAMPLFRDKDSVAWSTQELQLESYRRVLREALVKEAKETAADQAEEKAAQALSARFAGPFAGAVGLAAPSGLPSFVPSLGAIGAVCTTPVQEEQIRERLKQARADARVERMQLADIEGKIAQATQVSQLSDVERELIVRWLTRDPRVVFGGARIAAGKKK